MIYSLPKTLQQQAKMLVSRLKQHPNAISWAPNGEVIIHGNRKSGTNIIDLVGGVLRSRKHVRPQNEQTFLKTLASLNFPEEFVKNKYQLPKYREYKRKHLQAPNSGIVEEDGEYASSDNDTFNINRTEDILGQRHLKSLLKKQKRGNILKSKRLGVKKSIKWSSI